MSIDFEALKKRKGQSGVKALQEKLEKEKGGGFQEDPNIWRPSYDKETKGSHIIRFLPPVATEQDPFVHVIRYRFKQNGQWYNEISPKTIDRRLDDPVAQANSILFSSGDENLKNIARKRTQKHEYYANILVIKDSENPENNGKVFKFKFGKHFFNMIEKAGAPQYEDEVAFDPFDMWEGQNLLIRIKPQEMPNSFTGKTQIVPNYEDSKWEGRPTDLFDGDDDKKKEVWEQCYPLAGYVDPAIIKPYEELKAKFDAIVGVDQTSFGMDENNRTAETDSEGEDDFPEERKASPQKQKSAPAKEEPSNGMFTEEEEEFDSEAFFNSI